MSSASCSPVSRSCRTVTLPPAEDGQTPLVYIREGQEVRGVVVIAHGMGEHALRYAPLAEMLVQHGFVVYAHDHRGHGKTVQNAGQLGEYGPEGWQGLVRDTVALVRLAGKNHSCPVILLGHSMGSMVVQHILTENSDLLAGAALSGTTAVDMMAAAVAESGENTDLFAAFNESFAPVRTQFDWLSRDTEQVDLYMADPLCGFTVSKASLASLMEAGMHFSTPEATARIRKDLPVYFLAGSRDPVGMNGELVKMVVERYRAAGLGNVSMKLYAEARHEVFNETNRQEVIKDFIEWAVMVRDT